MPKMSRFCRAYYVRELERFAGWAPRAAMPEWSDDDVLYLHPNYSVTRGMYVDEDVVFESSDPAWQAFCRQTLEFDVPEYARDGLSAS